MGIEEIILKINLRKKKKEMLIIKKQKGDQKINLQGMEKKIIEEIVNLFGQLVEGKK